jgi:predicted Zn-dependent protease
LKKPPRLPPALLALVASLLLALPSAAQLPNLGDDEDFPLRKERIMGDWIARSIYKDPDHLDDPVLVDYVQGIWQPLMEAARARGDLTPELQERLAWRLVLARDASVNAFALPGGYLGVHTGLIALVQSRAELAGVMAHELSHVTQRHIARSIAQQNRQQPWMIAAMLLGMAALGKNADLGNAAIMGSQAAGVQGQLNFSRDMEREADRIGFGILTQAGFEGSGMVGMFRKLEQANRINDGGQYPYLRTHPLTGERIADMSARLTAPPSSSVDTLALLMAARARVLSRPDAESLHVLSRAPLGMAFSDQPVPTRMAALYAATLASSLLREQARTHEHLQRLGALVKNNPTPLDPASRELLDLLQIEAWLPIHTEAATRQVTQALPLAGLNQRVQQGVSRMPRPALLVWAQAQLRLGQAAAVVEALPAWLSLFPDDAQAWRWLARAHEALGQTSKAVRADAEARVAELDYESALDRLRAAQNLSAQHNADHFEQSILQSRVQAVRQLRLEQLDNEKVLR